jgi:regulatory protein
MLITRLKPVSRPSGFVAIEVDGARFAVLPVERAAALRLEPGCEMSDALAREVESAGAAEDAYRAAVRLLAAHGRSVQEMVTRLRRRGLRPDAVAEAVGRLEGAGLMDDVGFAETFARIRTERGYGRVRILADLSARGVERRVAERAVDAATPPEADRRPAIEALARKRAAQLTHVPAPVRLRRLVGFLGRRGFGGAEALAVAREVVREADADQPTGRGG